MAEHKYDINKFEILMDKKDIIDQKPTVEELEAISQNDDQIEFSIDIKDIVKQECSDNDRNWSNLDFSTDIKDGIKQEISHYEFLDTVTENEELYDIDFLNDTKDIIEHHLTDELSENDDHLDDYSVKGLGENGRHKDIQNSFSSIVKEEVATNLCREQVENIDVPSAESDIEHLPDTDTTTVFISDEELTVQKKPFKRHKSHHFCFYCEKSVQHFSRHLARKHKGESEVQRILSYPAKSGERRELITSLRKKGNYICSKHEAKPVRQPRFSETKTVVCPYCMGFYAKSQMWRHRRICRENEPGTVRALSCNENFLSQRLTVDKCLNETIFPKMRADEVTAEAEKDHLIREFGCRYLETHTKKHHLNVVSRKMREIARLLIEVKKIDGSVKNLLDALRPKHFNVIVRAVKVASGFDERTERYGAPTYATNINVTLKQCCDAGIYLAIKSNDRESGVAITEVEANLRTMKDLLKPNWKYEISVKISVVPLAADIKLLKSHLDVIADAAALALTKSKCDKIAFNQLQEVTYCKMTLLNRKRPGELQRLLLITYHNIQPSYEEFSNFLTPIEKILAKRFKQIAIGAKGDGESPILISPDVQRHIHLLLQARPFIMKQDNWYVFASMNTRKPMCGYKALEKHIKLARVKNPVAITATKLRRYVATITQIYHMTRDDVKELSDTIGHASNIHKKSYKLSDDIYQTAKLAKLLMLIENGIAGHFKGQSLEEISINMDEELSDDESENHFEVVKIEPPPEMSLEDVDPPCSHASCQQSNVKVRKSRVISPWTDDQKKVVMEFFNMHIRNKKPPRKGECIRLIAKYPEILENKSWLKIKVFVQNQYVKRYKKVLELLPPVNNP